MEEINPDVVKAKDDKEEDTNKSQDKGKQEGNHKSSRKDCSGREAFLRMNYLFQLSNLCTRGAIKGAASAGHLYAQQMIAISKKTVQRIEPAMKRKICKTCHRFQVPGFTCKVRIQKKVIVHTCLICRRQKRFVATPDYKLWIETPEARA